MADIRLHNVDCMDFMKGIPDKAYDLAIVDPPYGINAPDMQMGKTNFRVRDGRSGTAVEEQRKLKGRLNQGSGKLKNRLLNTSEIDWDDEIPPPEYFTELKRISKNQIIWGGNYFPLPPTRCIVCWDKLQPWENFSQWEMAWTSFDKPAIMIKVSNTGGANAEVKIHPTQKPVKVYKHLLTRLAEPGQRIIDTHLGSGSIAIACHDMGFDLDGCELKEKYFNDASKRLQNHQLQQKLFV